MQNDNEHQCNKLNNYIHTDEYLTAEVVQVVREIVAEETKEMEKAYDYRSVIYAIEHILLVYEKDISPNLHNKLTHWKKNIQEELDKE